MLAPRPWMFCAAAALAAACSTMPDTTRPRFTDLDVVADFEVGDDGRLAFPATTGGLVVRSLELTPAPLGEHFGADGDRWFVYPAGARVTVHGTVRAYDGAPGTEALRAALARARSIVSGAAPEAP